MPNHAEQRKDKWCVQLSEVHVVCDWLIDFPITI